MVGNKTGHGQATKAEGGLDEAMDRAWADAKTNGAQPGDTLTIHSIQVTGNNPITTYIVFVGP
jgi:hypothetical protein